MAVHFRLTSKTAPEAGPVDLNALDEEICRLYGEEPHHARYYYGWFDSVGWRLAKGDSWDAIREALQPRSEKDQADVEYCAVLGRLREIATWLEERFEVEHW